jgi:hypothetical protein
MSDFVMYTDRRLLLGHGSVGGCGGLRLGLQARTQECLQNFGRGNHLLGRLSRRSEDERRWEVEGTNFRSCSLALI